MLTKVLTGELTFSSQKPLDLSCCTKSDIRSYFDNSYSMNESLFTALKDESVFYKCPDRLRLPLIFYYGHTASVYINKLIIAGILKPEDRVNFEYETIFETGVDEMSWDDTENFRMGGKFNWPRLENVIEYRKRVRDIILKIIEETSLELPITMKSPWWGLCMGMEHERIHIETSSVLIRQLPVELVLKPEGWKYAPFGHGEAAGTNVLIRVDTTNMTMGKPEDFPSYGWDIEYGKLHCLIPTFEASRYLVTNREYLEFVQAGGYNKQEYWTKEAWLWLQYRKVHHPTFWVCDKGCPTGCGENLSSYSHCRPDHFSSQDSKPEKYMSNGQNSYCNGHSTTDGNGHQGKDEGGGLKQYRYRCMFDIVAMPWDWPVDTNYHEAKAFCAWKGPDYRLLTEAEHHAIRGTEPPPTDGTICDIIFQDNPAVNFNMKFGSSSPVNFFKENELGFHDVYGNVWEWVEDHFNGLPGIHSSYLYDDFSSPCLDGRHNLIMGGSWISTGDEASRFARFAFRRHFIQHSGFRVARSIFPPDGGKLPLPANSVTTEVFVNGTEIQKAAIPLDEKKYEYNKAASTYLHYLQDTDVHLQKMFRFEYGQAGLSYPEILVKKCENWLKSLQVMQSHTLHMGCGVGSGTWQLAKIFDHVIGIDFGGRCIHACEQLQKGETVEFTVSEESEELAVAKVDPNADISNVVFKQLTWLPNEIGFHDFILITFLDRVQNEKSWLVRMNEVLKSGGLLVISTPCNMGEEYLSQFIGHQFNLVDAVDLTGYSITQRVTAWTHKA